MTALAQFHLAFPVRDLEEARAFYVGVLGATEGRRDHRHIDFNLYGHHVVAHLAPEGPPPRIASEFDHREVPVPHFGLNLGRQDWEALAHRLKKGDARFLDPPHIRLRGRVGEHTTMFVLDPSGNALEFKSFSNPDEVFVAAPEEEEALVS